jgi:hypothetical protein
LTSPPCSPHSLAFTARARTSSSAFLFLARDSRFINTNTIHHRALHRARYGQPAIPSPADQHTQTLRWQIHHPGLLQAISDALVGLAQTLQHSDDTVGPSLQPFTHHTNCDKDAKSDEAPYNPTLRANLPSAMLRPIPRRRNSAPQHQKAPSSPLATPTERRTASMTRRMRLRSGSRIWRRS